MDGEPKKRNGKGNRGRLIAERLLVLRNYFYERASEGKGASWSEISDYLKSQSLAIDRKTFYRDCESLIGIFDLDLEYDTTDNKWYIRNPIFTEKELQTTINCIESASFLPQAKAEALAKKLYVLTCLDKVKTLGHSFQHFRIEKAYAHIKDNLKIILAAIDLRRCISFRYIVYPRFDEISESTSKEIDEYCRPKFYDESGNALHKYCNSGVCSPVYVEKRRDGYFLYLSERDAVSGEIAKRFINVAEMENIAILPDEQFDEEPDCIPWGAMSHRRTKAVRLRARIEDIDTIKLFFEDAKIVVHDDYIIADVLVENGLDLIPCILECWYSIKVLSPPEVIRSLENIDYSIRESFNASWRIF